MEPTVSCPFCGHQNIADPRQSVIGINQQRFNCRQCGACGPIRETEGSAIDAWNRRPSPPLPSPAPEGQSYLVGTIADTVFRKVSGAYGGSEWRLATRFFFKGRARVVAESVAVSGLLHIFDPSQLVAIDSAMSREP
jgi:Lar family restriction alleviation protein